MTDVLNPQMTGGSLSDRVAEEIRALLGRRRLSQAELARRLGVSGAWLNYRLTGKQPIDLNDLAGIAEALGVSPSSLLPPADHPTRGSVPRNRRNRHRGLVSVPSPAATPPTAGRPPDGRPPSYPQAARRPALTRRPAA